MVKALLALLLGLALANDDIFLGEKHKPDFVKFDDGEDYFYWLFYSRQDQNNDPLTIWLTGGPGCSSELAIFYENGPFTINDDLSLSKNLHSWNNNANLLYVDQPAGTGFSQISSIFDYETSERGIAQDFYKFLTKFLEANPEFKGRDLYITGESYAGHYIPAIASFYVKQEVQDMKLKAIAIGNGWTDPFDQYPAYATFSYENKLLSKFYYTILETAFEVCRGLIKTVNPLIALEVCQISSQSILGDPTSPTFNVYDIRKPCSVPPLCYDFSNMDKFIAREDVRAALGVGKRPWTSCDKLVHTFLLGDWVTNLQPNVIEALNADVKVLVYSGDKDWICNWRGGEAWTHKLDYAGKDEFNKLDYTAWQVDNVEAGQVKSAQGLTFLRVYDAGHMVPMDQPKNAFQMLTDFLYQ